MAKVEAIVDTNTGRKVPLPYSEDELPKIVQNLTSVILKNMPKEELQIYNEETEFFQKITEISGSLKVKEQSKPEKKAIIQKYLEKYQKELESRDPMKPPIYLITNPNMKIIKIITDTGSPMQSAARCPIMVSFITSHFEGPDSIQIENPRFAKLRLPSFEQKANIPNPDIPKNAIDTDLNEIKLELVPRKSSLEIQENNKDAQINKPLNTNVAFSQIILPDNRKMSLNSPFFDNKPSRKTVEPNVSAYVPSFKSPQITSAAKQQSIKLPNLTGRKSLSAKKMVQYKNKLAESGKVVSCIFKAKDDVRQDTLSLQIIKIFQEIFRKHNLDLFLYPYSTISNRTGESNDLGGIIECIPFSASRDQLGKAFDSDLYQYFIGKFGEETTAGFQTARKNFIKSLAAYSLISYIVQIKDRHNGNILIDNQGHIAHIDFGFIFDWSPGRDMRFESANFKLTAEMIRILGGDEKSEAYNLFVNLTIRGFLAIREYYDVIIATVYPMFHSGLPCFKLKSMQVFFYIWEKL